MARKVKTPAQHAGRSAWADTLLLFADTIVYAAAGHGAIISQGGAKRQDLSPGDFALIPAFEEHQEVNESDQDVKWIITRSGRTPAVVNLDAWGIC